MAILFTKRESEVLGDVLRDVTTNTGLTKASPGTKLRTLAESFSTKMGRLYTYVDTNLIQAFITGSSDKYLDFWGSILATPRLGRSAASVSANSQNIRFYVDQGTFGDINGGSSITLSAKTTISTGKGSTGILYRTIYSVLLPSTASEIYVAAEAINPGSRSNIGSGQLVYHNFVSYSDYLNESLKVNNEDEILNGAEVETDSNYRYRLSQAFTANEKGNATAIRLAILGVAGVADFLLNPYARGIGTFDAIIKSVAPRCSDTLIQAVQTALDEVVSFGNIGIAKKPDEVGLSIRVDLQLSEVVSDTDADTIVSNVQRSITNYVNNTDIAETIFINEIVSRVMNTDTRIQNMGTAGKPITEMYIYKPTRLQDDYSRTTLVDPNTSLINDYQTEVYERVTIYNGTVGDPVAVYIEGYNI